MISADLLLKGLGGLAVVGGATTVGVCYQQEKWIFAKEKEKKLSDLAGEVGLDCTGTNGQTDENGKDCTIKDGGLSVKQETNKETGKKKNTPQTGTEGKIRGYKDGKGFKFVIEGGDIALKEGSASNISKLEQFETYEIKEDGDKKQYLTRKNDARKEIKLALGLPEETDCDLPDTAEKTCNLDETKIKKINFDGKPSAGLTLGNGETTTISLKISKPSTDENTIFPHGYKFTLTSNRDINLGDSKSIKKDTNTEFKIKVTPAAGGPKVLTLEKAWSLEELAKKVGLKECADKSGNKECSLGDSININNADNSSDTNKKFTGLSKKDSNENNKKVKYEVDQEGYNQGFKFYSEQEISLKNSDGTNGDDKKIKAKGNDDNNPVTYQILKESSGTNWHLTKKTKTPGG